MDALRTAMAASPDVFNPITLLGVGVLVPTNAEWSRLGGANTSLRPRQAGILVAAIVVLGVHYVRVRRQVGVGADPV